jgi:predicted acetyltransferase
MDKFKPVCFEEREKIYSILSTIEKNDNGYINEFAEMTKEEFLTKGIQLLLDWSNGKNLYENFVPTTFYFLYDNDNNIVGVYKLRHYLNDHYRKGPGHISYAIKKDCRKKGYAKLGLHLAIKVLDTTIPEEEKLIKVCCSRTNLGTFSTIQGNIPVITKDGEREFKGKIVELCENYIDRKNRIVIKTLNEKDISNLNDEYLKNNIKNSDYIILGALLNNTNLIGYISLQKINEDYVIKNINIIENKDNLMYGLFNYAYAVARVNKIKNILIEDTKYELLKKEFPINEKYDCKTLDDKSIQINVKILNRFE